MGLKILIFFIASMFSYLEAKPGLLKQERNEFVYEQQYYQPMQSSSTVETYTPWQASHMSLIQEMANRMRQQYNTMTHGSLYTPMMASPMTPLAVYPMDAQHQSISWNMQAQTQEELNEMARKMTQQLMRNVNAGQFTPTDISRPDFFVHQAANAMEGDNRPFTNTHSFDHAPAYHNVEASHTIIENEKVTVYNPKEGRFESVYVNSNKNDNQGSESSLFGIKVSTTTPISVHEQSYFESKHEKQKEEVSGDKLEYSEFASLQSPDDMDYGDEYIQIKVDGRDEYVDTRVTSTSTTTERLIEPSDNQSFATNTNSSAEMTDRPKEDLFEDIIRQPIVPPVNSMNTQSKLHEEFDYDNDQEPQTPILVKEEPHLLVTPISKPSERGKNIISLVSSKKIENKDLQSREPIVFSRDTPVGMKPSNVMSMLPGKKQEVKVDFARLREHVGEIMKQTASNSSETHFMGMSSRQDEQKHVYSVAAKDHVIEQEPGIGYYSSEQIATPTAPLVSLAPYPGARKPFFVPQPSNRDSSLTLDSEVEIISQPANLKTEPRLDVTDVDIDLKDKKAEKPGKIEKVEVDEFGIGEKEDVNDDYDNQQQLVETFNVKSQNEKFTELFEEDLQQTRQDTYAIHPIHEELGHLGHAINPENGQKITMATNEVEAITEEMVIQEEEAKVFEIISTTEKPGLLKRFGQKVKNFFG